MGHKPPSNSPFVWLEFESPVMVIYGIELSTSSDTVFTGVQSPVIVVVGTKNPSNVIL